MLVLIRFLHPRNNISFKFLLEISQTMHISSRNQPSWVKLRIYGLSWLLQYAAWLLTFFLSFRTSSFLQPIILRFGLSIDGRRMAHCHRQHQHVHLRNRTCIHSNGERSAGQNARDHRMERRRLDTRPR